MPEKRERGLIQVYTGDGKGKTTAALGLALRAAGQGMRVGFIQFIKGETCGEHRFVSRYHPFEIVQMGGGGRRAGSGDEPGDAARRTLSYAREQMLSGRYDLLVLDEVLVAIHKGLITTQAVLDLMAARPDAVELVLTGRDAPPEIVDRADLVTEMRLIKHPFQKGIAARAGIEY